MANQLRVNRRNCRKTAAQLAEFHVRTGIDPPGLEVKLVNEEIGYGLFTTVDFMRGDFLVEYRGVRSVHSNCEEKDNPYVFEFYHHKERIWIDACGTDCLARYINDSQDKPNCRMKIQMIDGLPHLCAFLIVNHLPGGSELRYDYGPGHYYAWRKTKNSMSLKSIQGTSMGTDCEVVASQNGKVGQEAEDEGAKCETISEDVMGPEYKPIGTTGEPIRAKSLECEPLIPGAPESKKLITLGEEEGTIIDESEELRCEPAKPQCEPAEPQCEPAKPQCEPAEPQCEPAKPQCEPAEPQCEPVEPQCEPVEPQCEPAEPQCEPAKPQCEPAEPQCEPAKPQCEPEKPQCEPEEPQCEPAELHCEPAKPQCEPAKPQYEPEKPQCEPAKLQWEPAELQSEPAEPRCELAKPQWEPAEAGVLVGAAHQPEGPAVGKVLKNQYISETVKLDFIVVSDDSSVHKSHNKINRHLKIDICPIDAQKNKLNPCITCDDTYKLDFKLRRRNTNIIYPSDEESSEEEFEPNKKELEDAEYDKDDDQDDDFMEDILYESNEYSLAGKTSIWDLAKNARGGYVNAVQTLSTSISSGNQKSVPSKHDTTSDSSSEPDISTEKDELSVNEEHSDGICKDIESDSSGPSEKEVVNGVSGKRKKPHRPCPFCQESNSALTRHITAKHKDLPEVRHALSLPSKCKVAAFKAFRLQGMDQVNTKLMMSGKKEQDYIRVRNQGKVEKGDLAICTSCSGLFKRKHFYHHKSICFINTASCPASTHGLPLHVMEADKDYPKLWKEVLQHMVKDNISEFVKQDDMIKRVGQYEYERLKRDPSKVSTMRNRCSAIMRRLANLYLYFKEVAATDKELKGTKVSTEDLLNATYFYVLESAIDLYVKSAAIKAKKENDPKPVESDALQVAIGYTLKTCIVVMRAHFFIKYGRNKALEIDDFACVLKAKWPTVFANAEFKIKEKRATTLRKPGELPKEEDVTKMRVFNIKKMEELSDPYMLWTEKEFVEARDLVVSRLTFYNARRGNEPSKLLLREIDDALKSAWIIENGSNVGKHKLAYQSGKGNALVPTLITEECIPLIKKLVSSEVRDLVGVHPDNIFAFPSTRNSLANCSGWHAVNTVRKESGVVVRLNATKMRHRASTKFQKMNASDTVRQAFYDHMGHAAEINKHVYSSPAAEKEVNDIADIMDTIDKPAINTNNQPLQEPRDGGVEDNAVTVAVTGDKQEIIEITEERHFKPDDKINKKPLQASKTQKSGRRYHKWSEAEHCLVTEYFQDYILEQTSACTNCLPGKRKVEAFMEKHQILNDKETSEKIMLIKTKVNNERNKARARLANQKAFLAE